MVRCGKVDTPSGVTYQKQSRDREYYDPDTPACGAV